MESRGRKVQDTMTKKLTIPAAKNSLYNTIFFFCFISRSWSIPGLCYFYIALLAKSQSKNKTKKTDKKKQKNQKGDELALSDYDYYAIVFLWNVCAGNLNIWK